MRLTSFGLGLACALAGCAGTDAGMLGDDQGTGGHMDMSGSAGDLAHPGGSDGGAHDLATGGAHDLAGASTDMARQASTDMARVNTGHAIQTVFIILMENSNWSTVKGSASAPYINNTLLPNAAHAEAYNNVPGLHPSEPNYLWLEAGTNFGITADGLPSGDHQSSTAHLVTQLEAAGITWRSYQEGIDGTTCPLSVVGEYVPRHNPMVYFDDVTNSNDTAAARCLAHVRPYSELQGDLASGNVAQYNFITPNLCHDAHGSDPLALDFTCLPIVTDLLKTGDTWLSTEIPMIQASAAYTNGGAIFLTWDESEGSDVPIGMIVASPLAKTAAGGYSNSIAYTHSSTLKSMQEIFGVTPLLGGAADVATNDLADLFTTFP